MQLANGEQLTCDSAVEARVVQLLDKAVVDFTHHPKPPLRYTVEHTYTSDIKVWPLDGSAPFLVEVKGYWPSEDRNKWLKMWQQNPREDIRLAFQKPNTPLRKGARTTYAQWADKHGIKWCDVGTGGLPAEWTGVLDN